MILVADSGASKTAWRMIDGDKISQAQTLGMNPYQVSSEEIQKILSDDLRKQLDKDVDSIFFYGAGCLLPEKKEAVRAALRLVFPAAEVSVDTDMVGACYSVSAGEKSIVCILGTGANSCVFDGQNVLKTQPSLGYVLGDEGSGAYVGKLLLQHYFRNRMPEEIRIDFESMFDLDADLVLDKVYRQPMAARYLANFSRVLIDHKDHKYVYDLFVKVFGDFFDTYVLSYPEYETLRVHFVGSFAHYYNSMLRAAAKSRNITLGKIVESPIAGLALYHQKKNQ